MGLSLRNGEMLCTKQAITVFSLAKLRTGSSNSPISARLQLNSPELVTELGVLAKLTQSLISEHTTFFARNLFGTNNRLAIICGGTYLSIRDWNNDAKESPYLFQKRQHYINYLQYLLQMVI